MGLNIASTAGGGGPNKISTADTKVRDELLSLGLGKELFKEAAQKRIPPAEITKAFQNAGGGQAGLDAVANLIRNTPSPSNNSDIK